MEIVIRIIISALIGYLINILCQKMIPLILEKRNRTIVIEGKEAQLLLIIMVVVGGFIGYRFNSIAMISYAFILLAISEMIAIIDWHERIIPNELWQAIIIVKLLFCIPTFFNIEGFQELDLVQSILGYVVCFVIFAAPSLYKKNVGAGDVKLAAAIGFGLGLWNALFAIVIMGFIILVYSSVKKNMPMLKVLETMIPMGPFIVSGMMGVLFWIN